jgi:rubredoxin
MRTKLAVEQMPDVCPKCGEKSGLYYDSDPFGETWSCLYCGWHIEVANGPPLEKVARQGRKIRDGRTSDERY